MTRRQRVKLQRNKLSSTEYKLALGIAKVIVVLLAILAYLLRAIGKSLFKTKRWLYRLSIVILIVHSALNGLSTVAYAPKADAVFLGPDNVTEYQGEDGIDNYIRTIFGKDANVAIAVHKAECSPFNKTYPKCGPYITSREHSCGIFQINLKAHWNKVPVGNTYGEKCKYLEDPFNNTLVAYKIFKDSGFYPWTAFTGGNYLKNL